MDFEQFMRENWFTEQAREIVTQTISRSFRRRVTMVGTTVSRMLLWAILRWEITLALSLLNATSGNATVLESYLKTLVDEMEPFTKGPRIGGHVSVSSEGVAELVRAALRRAQAMGDDYVGTEHLLLAALSRSDLQLRSTLQACHVDEASVNAALMQMRG